MPEGFFEHLVVDCPDAVIFADRDGKIKFWNRSAERVFGFPAAEALGQSLDLIVPERQRARHWEGYDRVMTGGASRYGEGDLLAVPAVRKDERRISIEFTILPLYDAGALPHFCVTLRTGSRNCARCATSSQRSSRKRHKLTGLSEPLSMC